MGFFSTFLKTAATWDLKYVERYERAGIIRGAILELCRIDGFKAYLTRSGSEPIVIDAETDLSVDSLHNFALEIDLKNDVKNLYIGIGKSESPTLKKYKAGAISEKVKNLHYRDWPIYRYETSFDGYRDIKSRISQMLEIQAGESGNKEQSLFHQCPRCSQRINAPKFKTLEIVCPTCNHAWVANA